MPQTFSPTVSMMPAMADPLASDSQFLLATAVEPRPAMTKGSFSCMGFLFLVATVVLMSTFSKKALSGLGSMP